MNGFMRGKKKKNKEIKYLVVVTLKCWWQCERGKCHRGIGVATRRVMCTHLRSSTNIKKQNCPIKITICITGVQQDGNTNAHHHPTTALRAMYRHLPLKCWRLHQTIGRGQVAVDACVQLAQGKKKLDKFFVSGVTNYFSIYFLLFLYSIFWKNVSVQIFPFLCFSYFFE